MIEKRSSAELLRLEALLARQEWTVRRAFAEFLADAKSDATIRQVRALIEAGRIEEALRITDQYVIRFGTVVPQIFTASATAEIVSLIERLTGPLSRVALSFDPSNPRAAAAMRVARLDLIREFTDAQRNATRIALTNAFQTGQGSREAARAFRDSIGLTGRQEQTVRNYRRLLETGSREALARDLRDRRFDATVRSAVDRREPLNQAQIDRMVTRYRERMLAFRAENIARTEGGLAAAIGRREAMVQMMEMAGIPDNMIERTWRVTRDGRQRESHDHMQVSVVRGMNTPFITGAGVAILYPHDPNVPASERANCRCVEVFAVKREQTQLVPEAA